jgi:glycosyltransferase involved in cell wall biosynthesis
LDVSAKKKTVPKFSIVIPTYNRARTVTRAVQSVLGQTFKDYDIWVIDDGSDDTETVLSAFAGFLNYRRGANAGVAAARNLGVDTASGLYIAFLDADDWWYPTKLERILEKIQEWPKAMLFYSRVDFVNEEGIKLWSPNIRDVGEQGYIPLLEGNFIVNSSVVISKECLKKVGGFDTTLSGCEDWDLWVRVARCYPIRLVPEVLVAYQYLSEGSFTSSYHSWLKSADEVVEKALRDDTNLGKEVKRRIRSSLLYIKGRICLGAEDEKLAHQEFQQAVALYPTNWRARIYLSLLKMPRIRSLLPIRVKKALRLPEAYR